MLCLQGRSSKMQEYSPRRQVMLFPRRQSALKQRTTIIRAFRAACTPNCTMGGHSPTKRQPKQPRQILPRASTCIYFWRLPASISVYRDTISHTSSCKERDHVAMTVSNVCRRSASSKYAFEFNWHARDTFMATQRRKAQSHMNFRK